jgi:hypothetical protein
MTSLDAGRSFRDDLGIRFSFCRNDKLQRTSRAIRFTECVFYNLHTNIDELQYRWRGDEMPAWKRDARHDHKLCGRRLRRELADFIAPAPNDNVDFTHEIDPRAIPQGDGRRSSAGFNHTKGSGRARCGTTQSTRSRGGTFQVRSRSSFRGR